MQYNFELHDTIFGFPVDFARGFVVLVHSMLMCISWTILKISVGLHMEGILLGGGTLVLFGGNAGTLPLIIGGLKTHSSQTGCDNIVNWDSLNSDQLNLLT